MSDALLLYVIAEKATWLRFRKFIKPDVLSKAGKALFDMIPEYYGSHPTHEKIEWDAFETMFFLLRSKSIKEDQALLCRKILADVKGLSLSATPPPLASDVVKHYVRGDTLYNVMEACNKMMIDPSMDLGATLQAIVEAHDKEVGKVEIVDDDIFAPCSLSVVLKSVSAPGLNWRLNELNRSLGPARQGDFIILGARPETGKTTMLASEMTFWAEQLPLNRPIIWVNNEERSSKVMYRVMQAFFGVDNATLAADVSKYEAEYAAKMGKRILVINNDSGFNDVHSLDALFKDKNPGAIVFDQLDKVNGFTHEDREDLRLGRLYNWGRDKSHQYGPVIAVSQATGDDYQKYIPMSALRGSKTDKAGEADAIITIGKTNEPGMEYNRYIHVPKNKMHGGPMSVEAERHAYYEVLIQPTIGRYKGAF